MAAPRVFVSSTFYDLRYIRENLRNFITGLGYDAVLSEDGAVFYDPSLHVHESAVSEVSGCQVFVLVIGGRFGSQHVGQKGSVTNAEYEKAVKEKIPVFALVEREVLDQYRVYLGNIENPKADEIVYPAVDDGRIFGFIEQVQGQLTNNALVPFSNFDDIHHYLRQQWASMMFNFLTSASEAGRVSGTLAMLTELSEKIEFLSREVLNAVGDTVAKASAEAYDIIQGFERATSSFDEFKTYPEDVLRSSTLEELFERKGYSLSIEDLNPDDGRRDHRGLISNFDPDTNTVTIDVQWYKQEKAAFEQARDSLLATLAKYGLTVDQYLAREPQSQSDEIEAPST